MVRHSHTHSPTSHLGLVLGLCTHVYWFFRQPEKGALNQHFPFHLKFIAMPLRNQYIRKYQALTMVWCMLGWRASNVARSRTGRTLVETHIVNYSFLCTESKYQRERERVGRQGKFAPQSRRDAPDGSLWHGLRTKNSKYTNCSQGEDTKKGFALTLKCWVVRGPDS